MTTVVFGASGFVGLNIVEALLARGEAVRGVDVTPPPPAATEAMRALPGRFEMRTLDVREAADVRAAVDGAHHVLCGAAVTSNAAREAAEPELVLSVNLEGFMNVLRASRDAGVGRIVNISSAGAYGRAALGANVLSEGTPADPETIYSITKFASERLTDRMADLWGLDALSVRLSAVFGRWERQTSVRDTPSAPFQIMRAALEGRPAILDRPGARDWTYAPDVAAAIIALLGAQRLRHRLYNVSTGTRWDALAWGQTVAEQVDGFVCRLAGPGETANVDFFTPQDRPAMDVSRLIADTGFAPEFDRDASVADYLTWVRGRGADYA